jgi:hypothetical protein
VTTWDTDVPTDFSADYRACAEFGRKIREPSRSHAFDSAVPAEHTDV